MAEEVRFTVSDETEVVLQEVMRRMNISRNLAAHFCMSLGLSAINSMLQPADMEILTTKLAERLAPGMEKAVQGAFAILLQPQFLHRFLDDAGVSPEK